MKPVFFFTLASLAIGVGLAACGDDESSTTSTTGSGATSGTGASGGASTSTGGGGTAGAGGGTAGSGGMAGGGTAGAGGAGGAGGGAGGGNPEGGMCSTDDDCDMGLVCLCPNDACHDCGDMMGSCSKGCQGG